jgi:hypothetical protein
LLGGNLGTILDDIHENAIRRKRPHHAYHDLSPTRSAARVRILFGRVEQPIFRACSQRIEAPLLRLSLSPIPILL